MKIGLIRHFKVDCIWPASMDSAKLEQAVINYNEASCRILGPHPDISQYKQCYASDMSRAAFTAREIWTGHIIFSPLLREVMMSPVIDTKAHFPVAFWKIASKFAWFWNGKTQPEGRKYTEDRARRILDEIIETRTDTLVVAHGFFMMILQKEMYKRGFKGEYFFFPPNGKLFEFVKKR